MSSSSSCAAPCRGARNAPPSTPSRCWGGAPPLTNGGPGGVWGGCQRRRLPPRPPLALPVAVPARPAQPLRAERCPRRPPCHGRSPHLRRSRRRVQEEPPTPAHQPPHAAAPQPALAPARGRPPRPPAVSPCAPRTFGLARTQSRHFIPVASGGLIFCAPSTHTVCAHT